MTTPEPVEVAAGELAAAELATAEQYFRERSRFRPSATAGAMTAGDRYRVLMAEFDRMRAELARALPVVEAAGAVVEHLNRSPSWKFGSGLTSESVELISRLGIAIHAAREPRTGERG